jgi:deoxyguanosine kinase
MDTERVNIHAAGYLNNYFFPAIQNHLLSPSLSMKYRFITVEGNIGAGKTTLSTLLQKHFQAKLILEEFADNPFLPKFYLDKEKYSFPLELSFLADRYRQMKDLLNTRDLFSQLTISDYLFIKCKLFAKVNLPPDEYQLFSTLFDIIFANLPEPDLLIYLHAPLNKLTANIKQRNRDYEQNMDLGYLERLQDIYSQLLRSEMYPTLIIDTSETDFVNRPDQFNQLLAHLEKDYSKGRHYIEIV